MPGLDTKVAVHRLAVSKERRYVKQAPRHFRPELEVQIKAEIDKLIDVGFIREVQYPTWLANFRDLNDACPKDEFPLPTTELLVDATTGFEALSFMDGFSRYNQIKMAPEDEELTTFRTSKGIYCYTKAIKGQALADFLAAHPIPDNMELPSDLQDEEVFSTYISQWQLYFNGAARKKGVGTEYEALIIGLEIALELHVDSLQAYGDSQLINKQMNGQYAVKNENLTSYHERAKHLVSQFQEINIAHIPRSENNKVDALAKLAASLTLPEEREVKITVGERHLLPLTLERIEENHEVNAVTVLEVDECSNWRQSLIDYL
nr:uncharacterized protein LOC114820431 [Malus domestica]